jgi:hypothetical protein
MEGRTTRQRVVNANREGTMRLSQERVVELARKRQAAEAEERRIREELRRVCSRLGPRRPYTLPGLVSKGDV